MPKQPLPPCLSCQREPATDDSVYCRTCQRGRALRRRGDLSKRRAAMRKAVRNSVLHWQRPLERGNP